MKPETGLERSAPILCGGLIYLRPDSVGASIAEQQSSNIVKLPRSRTAFKSTNLRVFLYREIALDFRPRRRQAIIAIDNSTRLRRHAAPDIRLQKFSYVGGKGRGLGSRHKPIKGRSV
jgi:hypothetical protein